MIEMMTIVVIVIIILELITILNLKVFDSISPYNNSNHLHEKKSSINNIKKIFPPTHSKKRRKLIAQLYRKSSTSYDSKEENNIKLKSNNISYSKHKSKQIIPKVIYQTWYKRNFSSDLQNAVNNMLKLNPSYKHKVYLDHDMDQFVYNNYDDIIIQCYNKLNIMVSKTDFWRYLILYKKGGIYLDIDSTITKPLHKLISANDEAIISFESKSYFVQWALIFKKEHPILKRTIELVVNNILNGNAQTIHELTGPYVYSQAIREIYFEIYNADANAIIYNNISLDSVKTGTDKTYYTLPKNVPIGYHGLNSSRSGSSTSSSRRSIRVTGSSSRSSDNDQSSLYTDSITNNTNNTHNNSTSVQSSYRIFGMDYNGFFIFKINNFQSLYKKVNFAMLNWRKMQKTIPLLKNNTINRVYKNNIKFENYTLDNDR